MRQHNRPIESESLDVGYCIGAIGRTTSIVDDRIGRSTGVERDRVIGPVARIDRNVVTCAAIDDVVACTAGDNVVTALAKDRVVTCSAGESIAAVGTVVGCRIVEAIKDVVSVTTIDDVAP